MRLRPGTSKDRARSDQERTANFLKNSGIAGVEYPHLPKASVLHRGRISQVCCERYPHWHTAVNSPAQEYNLYTQIYDYQ